MLALQIDYLYGHVYRRTAWTTVRFDIMSYLTQFSVAHSKTCAS